MKTALGIAAVVAMSISGYASAWTSTFFDRTHGGSYTETGAATPEEAQRFALQECRKIASDTECVELGSPKHGTAVVLVKGSKESVDNRIFIETDSDPEKAATLVLNKCGKIAKDCRLALVAWDDGRRWATVASSKDDAMFLEYSADTRESAEAGAVRGCEERASKKGTCQVQQQFTQSTRVWYAFARSDNYTGMGLSGDSEQAAKALALESCAEGSRGSPCRVTEVAENPGPKSAPPSFGKLKARIEREEARRNSVTQKQAPKKVATSPAPGGEGNCRPRGDTLRCTSQCYNGNCIVTYENGCKVRVQVQPKFNPFNNQWDYPSPSC